ncbi:hypothetical protein [Halomonas sp. RA08-2]|uniref:hypothetical protein n=1 Tax=Halomonas sp. RA08-2 TaxID=3440842 RepID=UPI003EEDDC82
MSSISDLFPPPEVEFKQTMLAIREVLDDPVFKAHNLLKGNDCGAVILLCGPPMSGKTRTINALNKILKEEQEKKGGKKEDEDVIASISSIRHCKTARQAAKIIDENRRQDLRPDRGRIICYTTERKDVAEGLESHSGVFVIYMQKPRNLEAELKAYKENSRKDPGG